MTVIEYVNAKNVTVAFDNGYKKKIAWSTFLSGEVQSVYDRTVYGVGYLGEGPYTAMDGRKQRKAYSLWLSILDRGYSEKTKKKHTTYKDCTVVEEWHNFQNFAKWFYDNYYEIEGHTMNLDKDILVRGNKCYGPDTCVFVPQQINKLFIKLDNPARRLPLGVHFHKATKRYYASINVTGRLIRKQFATAEEAARCYIEIKEAHIKAMAEKYKDEIPNKLYEAMITFRL